MNIGIKVMKLEKNYKKKVHIFFIIKIIIHIKPNVEHRYFYHNYYTFTILFWMVSQIINDLLISFCGPLGVYRAHIQNTQGPFQI